MRLWSDILRTTFRLLLVLPTASSALIEARASILYTAVIRGKVALPCDITPPSADDAVALVLWYKDEGPAPIYTLDARRGHVDQARQSAVSELGARAYFNMMNRPAFLQLDPVEEDDAGEYRCRVDFRKARSVNTVINLKVIVPPGEPVILDEDGKQLQGLVGPFNEGDPLQLTCQVDVGKPRPSVTWWKDYALLDESYFFSADGALVKNKLEVAAITRNDLLAILTCQAANNNITVPASSSITLDLNLKPLDVTIQPPERPLSANKEVELICSSSGSRPAAVLSWWKGGHQIRSARDEDSKGGLSATTSVLLFTPSVDDNNRILSCRAENRAIPGSALEEGWKLEVFYAPIVTLDLGGNLKDTEIQEGRDVYLDCKIVANPYTSDVGWLFEGRELTSNATAGIIVSTQSLVLQRVQRAQRGRYACSATNKEGRGVSKELYLRVKYAPVCKTGQKWVYGVSKEESVSVRCDLDADPVEASFHWVFNSSTTGKRRDVVHGVSASGARSVLNYEPITDDDYGTLYCWGTNSVGIQRDPCPFTIVPSRPPDGVINCSQINATENGMSLECLEGPWDGGGMSPAVFVAEVYELDSDILRANLSSSTGRASFLVRGLPGGTSFRVLVYATNGKGRSASFSLIAHTLKPAEKFTAGAQGMIVIRPFLGVLIGIVIALVIAAIVVIIIIRCKRLGRPKCTEKERLEDKSLTLLKKDPDESVDLEEKGPDIIPATTVFAGYDAAREKMIVLSSGMDSYSSSVPVKGCLDNFGNHRTGSPKKDGSEVTYAELSFPKAAGMAVVPVTGGGTLRRTALHSPLPPQLPDPPTEYARIDFHRTLRPVPGNLGLTGDELEDEGGSTCETPLMASRRESTV